MPAPGAPAPCCGRLSAPSPSAWVSGAVWGRGLVPWVGGNLGSGPGTDPFPGEEESREGCWGCQEHLLALRLQSACRQLSWLPAACIPDASYDYLTASASDHIRSLTLLPGSASHLRFCKTAHSQADVGPSSPASPSGTFFGALLPAAWPAPGVPVSPCSSPGSWRTAPRSPTACWREPCAWRPAAPSSTVTCRYVAGGTRRGPTVSFGVPCPFWLPFWTLEA